MNTRKEYNRKYYLANKKHLNAVSRSNYYKNREHYLEYRKQYASSHKEEISLAQKKYGQDKSLEISLNKKNYFQKNKEKIYSTRAKKRVSFDPNNKLLRILRGRVTDVMRGRNKPGSAIKDLGCTVIELKFYLEGKFKDGMTWENHSRTGWHIDHVIPLSFFDLTDRTQFLQACHYTNLQPLWAKENISKGKKIYV